MKFILGLLLVCGALFLLMYYGGGLSGFDPSQHGRDAKAAIQPGMSWKKVMDAAGKPREYRIMIIQKGFPKPGPVGAFDEKALAGRIDAGTMENGFVFGYRFSESVAFDVYFDGAGNVTTVADAITMSKLLDMPGSGG